MRTRNFEYSELELEELEVIILASFANDCQLFRPLEVMVLVAEMVMLCLPPR